MPSLPALLESFLLNVASGYPLRLLLWIRLFFSRGGVNWPEDTSLALVDMAIGFLASECLSTAATESPLKLLL